MSCGKRMKHVPAIREEKRAWRARFIERSP